MSALLLTEPLGEEFSRVARALHSRTEPETALGQCRAVSMLLTIGAGFALQRIHPLQVGILISAALGEAAIRMRLGCIAQAWRLS